jgi:FKBP-type peptidyl-prolyl cis-trans isomerase
METTSSGLSYEDTVVGTGPSPTRGQTCVMHYTGWLWVNGAAENLSSAYGCSIRVIEHAEGRFFYPA